MGDNQDGKRWVAIGLILVVFILAFFVLRPIVMSIIFGLLFAYIFTPVYKKINSKVKYKNLSALILIFAIIILIAIPLIYLIPELLEQVEETYSLLQDINFKDVFEGFLSTELATKLSLQVNNVISQLFASLVGELSDVLMNLPSLALQFVVFLFTFYFAVRDNEELKNYISKLSPFSSSTGNKFFREFRGITNAIVYGQVLIGIIQGLLLGVGFYFLGIPKILILTFIACIVSIIPVLGAWLVWFPVGIFMIAVDRTFAGVFIFLYGAIFISTIDNLLRPIILSKSSSLPVSVSVIGTIGGLYFFGIIGLILGPLILAYVLIIIDFYKQGKLNDLFNK
ncbi:MAG: AI-2E family transporter [Candidatus Pacearchaeota archaeon]